MNQEFSFNKTKNLDSPKFIKEYKEKSILKLKKAEMPEFKHGLNILIQPNNLNLEKLEKNKGKSEQLVKIENSEGIKIYEKPTEESEKYFQEFLDEKWETDNNKIDYFNNIFSDKTLLIYIPKNTNEVKKIEIDYKLKKTLINKLFIFLEENTKAEITITKSGEGDYASEDIRIIAKENSELSIVNFQNFSENTINFEKRRIIEGENAEVSITDLSIGSEFTRSETKNFLNGINSRIDQKILFLTKKNQKKDISCSAIHNSEKTYSSLETRGALKDNSKALSRSLIKINKDAADSKGYEKQDSIILDKNAEADAIPKLEIKNPNVKCSHGSTIGQIDSEKIFYLMSRGLNKETAKQKIVEGYFNKFIITLKNKEIREKIREIITVNLK